MKIGSIDILKAYLGALELVSSNAFIGSIPIIDNPTPIEYDGLKMTSTGNSTVALSQVGTAPTVDLKYSLDDGNTWVQWDFSAISLNDGDSVCFKGQNTAFGTGESNYNKFVMTGSIAASGNIMSIIDNGANNTTTIPADYCFCSLFRECAPLTTVPELPATTLRWGCYRSMFQNCTSLTTAPALPATTLAENCYRSMFYDCTGLTTATTLPATTLTTYCYYYMFRGCTALTAAPALPATTLAASCYYGMFQNCTSLTIAPELPATTLAENCYRSMFHTCTSLTSAPVLPATTLTQNCYRQMFQGCTNLNYIKCLATDISASSCTTNWVSDVAATGTFIKAENVSWSTGVSGIPTGWTAVGPYKGLKMTSTGNSTVALAQSGSAPTVDLKYSLDDGDTWTQWDFSAISLTDGQSVCFKGLNTTFATRAQFYNKFVMTGSIAASGNIMSIIDDGACTTTTISNSWCFASLFVGCTALTSAPELPATTLSSSCYYSMFMNCTALTSAPELPATTLANNCYSSMFSRCTNLNYIKCLATNISASTCTDSWVYGVAATGTFVKYFYNRDWTIGTDGIPSGWTVETEGEFKGLKFTSTGNSTVALAQGRTGSSAAVTPPTVDLKYSLDEGETWTQWDFSAISLNDGDSICLKGQNTNFCNFNWSTYAYNYFVMTGSIAANGNIMSIIDNGACTTTTIPATYCFYDLFHNCTSLTTAPALPATVMKDHCYRALFSGCTSLTTAPALPATTLAVGCYAYMFSRCTSLTTAPALPATTLKDTCYNGMFSECTSLINVPILPATTLKSNCYNSMFYKCTSLTTAPVLNATKLVDYCYNYMFNGCTNLNYIKCLATNISASGCIGSWVSGVAATGTFVKKSSMTSWTTGTSGIPSGWTVQDAA